MDITDILFAKKLSGGGGGSSDFSIAEVTIAAGVVANTPYELPIISPEYWEVPNASTTLIAAVGDDDYVVNVILHKGKCYAYVDEDIVISGDATYDAELGVITITGDCILKGCDDK